MNGEESLCRQYGVAACGSGSAPLKKTACIYVELAQTDTRETKAHSEEGRPIQLQDAVTHEKIRAFQIAEDGGIVSR